MKSRRYFRSSDAMEISGFSSARSSTISFCFLFAAYRIGVSPMLFVLFKSSSLNEITVLVSFTFPYCMQANKRSFSRWLSPLHTSSTCPCRPKTETMLQNFRRTNSSHSWVSILCSKSDSIIFSVHSIVILLCGMPNVFKMSKILSERTFKGFSKWKGTLHLELWSSKHIKRDVEAVSHDMSHACWTLSPLMGHLFIGSNVLSCAILVHLQSMRLTISVKINNINKMNHH